MKFGALKLFGPSDTTSVTVWPGWSRPSAGFCRITRPRSMSVENFVFDASTTNPASSSACVASSTVAPTTFGTGTGFGPLLTTTSIALLRGAFPFDGDVLDRDDDAFRLIAEPLLRGLRQREVRALEQRAGFGDRLADQVRDGHRLRTQRGHQRDGGALLERRPGHGIDARHVARRDVESVDPGSAIFTLNPRSIRLAFASSTGVPISRGTSA